MELLYDIMYYVCIFLLICIIVISLPLVPNKKLRYYTCAIGYAVFVTIIGVLLLPLGFVRPRNIKNLKLVACIYKHYTKILGIEWIIKGEEELMEDREAIIVSNHQTIYDSMGIFNIWHLMDKCTAVSKREILYYFPLGQLAWLAGLVFIDRTDPKSAFDAIECAAEHLRGLKAKFWICPEGTRNTNTKALLPFKMGAFKVAICTRAPIIPVVFSPYYFIDTNKKTLSKGKVIISVLDAIPTEGLTLDDVDALKEKTYKLMTEEYEKLKIEIETFQQSDINKNEYLKTK